MPGMGFRRLFVPGALAMIAAGGAFYLYAHPPSPGRGYPSCVLHDATGLHCAGCGITRASHALLHLRVREAFAMNPLFVVALPLVLAGLAVEATARFRGARYRGPRVRLPARAYWWFLATVLAFWVLRNIPAWPFSLLAPH